MTIIEYHESPIVPVKKDEVTVRCECGAKLKRNKYIVRSFKRRGLKFRCAPCKVDYHRRYSLKSYYENAKNGLNHASIA